MLTKNNNHANELRSNFKNYNGAGSILNLTKATRKAEEKIYQGNLSTLLHEEEKEEDLNPNKPESEIDVVKEYIRSSYDTIRRNKLTKRIELNLMGEKQDLDDRTVNGWLDHLWNYKTYSHTDGRNGKEVIRKVTLDKNKLYTLIDNESFSPSYDPIAEYFQRVAPMAAGTSVTPEIDKFIGCFTCENDNEVVEQYFKAWLAGVFINYYTSDKFDGILILQSNQGTGKTTAIEHHLLKPFVDYVTKNFVWSTSSKDEMIKLATSLFIFDDELSATRKSEVEELKKITSLTVINNVRPPYGRTAENYIRRTSFIGATNNTSIINDVTGSRRFLVLGVQAIDLAAVSRIDYDLLWSEAYNYFHVQGNKIRIDFKVIEENNEKYKNIGAEDEYLDRHFDFTKEGNTWLSATEVLDFLKEQEPNLYTDHYKIGKALKAKGKEAQSRRLNGGGPTKRYHLHQLTGTTSQRPFTLSHGGNSDAATESDYDAFFL
ncbi:VapE domain-containing protein [Pontibacter sp. 13R65]|uniref:VapE domain-containing protein n=1 Tax=Pontibacter sp. 13R65 TaxID=3127458 RepID=UPI00301D2F7B